MTFIVDQQQTSAQPTSSYAVPGLRRTAIEIITSALRKLNVTAAGEESTAAEAQDGLVALNQMLDSWQTEKLLIYTVDILDFAYQSGKQNYTLGPGGDWNMPRPSRIEHCSTILQPGSPNPIELSMTYTTLEKDWQKLLVKSVSTNWPWLVYDSGDYPQRTLRVWPIPKDANNIRIYSWQALAQFEDLATPKIFPPGYAEAIQHNLAIRMSTDYPDAQISPVTMAVAREALSRIKALNLEVPQLECDVITDTATGGTSPWSSDIPPIF